MHALQDILYSQWNGKSALMLAAQSGHTKTVRALLNAGAEVNITSYVLVTSIKPSVYMQAPAILHLKWKGNTALVMAAKGGHTKTVKILIEAGADVAGRNTVS